MTSLSVVIPVYNSTEVLPSLLKRLVAVLPAFSGDYEIILVNDGSKDASWNTIVELSKSFPSLHGIDLMRNFGQHNALLIGIRAAEKDVIVTMDDDLQHPPEEIYKLLAKLAEGHDVVYGTPDQEQHGLLRNLASQTTKLVLQQYMGVENARRLSAFRAFRTPLREAFANYNNSFVSIDVLLTWSTTRFGAVTVPHHPRFKGASNYTLGKLLRHALNMLTGFSTLPLQIASILGFLFMFFSILISSFVILRYLVLGVNVPGFTFLALTISLFAGVQLFALGIIGEYLARMYFRMLGKPAGVVRSTVLSSHSQGITRMGS